MVYQCNHKFKKKCSTPHLVKEERLESEMQMLVDMTQNCIGENARIAQNQRAYQQRYNELVSRYEGVKEQYDALSEEIQTRRMKAELLDKFSLTLPRQDAPLIAFDEDFWGTLVEYMTIYEKNDIGVTFKDGTEIRV